MSQAQNYTQQKLIVDSIEVVRLTDSRQGVVVSIAPSLGNNAYEMKVHGHDVFWSPYSSPAELKAKPTFAGNPFLAPWANRLEGDWFYANGHKYLLNPELKNYRYDPNHQPIHGLVSYTTEWKVVDSGADDRSAWVTSRLEFWKQPEWMAQFPFAHAIEMTYRVADGALEVHTRIENLSSEPMPLSIGYHPYFRIEHRDSWRVHLPVKLHVALSDKLIPTGEMKPMELADPLSLQGAQLDDVFTGIVRDAAGRAEFWVENGDRRITVAYGEKFGVAVVYAPPGRDFVCFEPMTGITNAFNLAEQGKYDSLQKIPPGTKWEESYWIRTQGY